VSIVRTISIAAATTAIAVSGLALAPAASAAPGDTTVINCVGKGQIRPKEIVITCADANVLINKITWTTWNNNAARGRGTLAWNTCLPKTCVDGIVQTYKVKIRLGRVASGPNASVFTGLTLGFPGGGPAAAETTSYTLDRPIR
jgi:hypothetical protein